MTQTIITKLTQNCLEICPKIDLINRAFQVQEVYIGVEHDRAKVESPELQANPIWPVKHTPLPFQPQGNNRHPQALIRPFTLSKMNQMTRQVLQVNKVITQISLEVQLRLLTSTSQYSAWCPCV